MGSIPTAPKKPLHSGFFVAGTRLYYKVKARAAPHSAGESGALMTQTGTS